MFEALRYQVGGCDKIILITATFDDDTVIFVRKGLVMDYINGKVFRYII